MRRTAVGDSDNKGVRPIIASGGPDQRQGTYRGVVMWVRFPLSVTIYAGSPLPHSSLVGDQQRKGVCPRPVRRGFKSRNRHFTIS